MSERRLTVPGAGAVTSMRLAAGATRLLLRRERPTAVLWDLERNTQLWENPCGGGAPSLVLDPTGRHFAAFYYHRGRGARVQVVSLATGEVREGGTDSQLRASAFSADGETLAWSYYHVPFTYGEVDVWRPGAPKPEAL